MPATQASASASARRTGTTGGDGPPPRGEAKRGGLGVGGAILAGIVGAAVVLGGAAALQRAGYLSAPGGSADQATQGTQNGADPDAIQALGDSVDELRAQVEGQGGSYSQAIQSTLDELSTRLDQLETGMSDSGTSLTAAQEQFDQASQTAQAAQEAADQADRATQELQQSFGDFEQRFASLEAANRQARVALAAASLKAAIDAGDGFADELQTYSELTGQGGNSEGAAAALQPFAESGIPSEDALAARWPDVEDAVRQELQSSTAGRPIGEQVMAGLQSLVQVRETGSSPEDPQSPDAVLTKLDTAIRDGDFPTFMETWNAMPQDAREAGSDFAAQVEARATADDVVAKALSDALEGDAGGGASGESSGAAGGNQG